MNVVYDPRLFQYIRSAGMPIAHFELWTRKPYVPQDDLIDRILKIYNTDDRMLAIAIVWDGVVVLRRSSADRLLWASFETSGWVSVEEYATRINELLQRGYRMVPIEEPPQLAVTKIKPDGDCFLASVLHSLNILDIEKLYTAHLTCLRNLVVDTMLALSEEEQMEIIRRFVLYDPKQENLNMFSMKELLKPWRRAFYWYDRRGSSIFQFGLAYTLRIRIVISEMYSTRKDKVFDPFPRAQEHMKHPRKTSGPFSGFVFEWYARDQTHLEALSDQYCARIAYDGINHFNAMTGTSPATYLTLRRVTDPLESTHEMRRFRQQEPIEGDSQPRLMVFALVLAIRRNASQLRYACGLPASATIAFLIARPSNFDANVPIDLLPLYEVLRLDHTADVPTRIRVDDVPQCDVIFYVAHIGIYRMYFRRELA